MASSRNFELSLNLSSAQPTRAVSATNNPSAHGRNVPRMANPGSPGEWNCRGIASAAGDARRLATPQAALLATLGGGELRLDRLPVHRVPPRINVVGPQVLVLQVIGVLPHVHAQNRHQPLHQRAVLVRLLDRFEFAAR